MARPKLTQVLVRRILNEIKLGVPSQVAARKFGVDLSTWVAWLTEKKGRKYVALREAVDRAEAEATADFTPMLRKAAKKKGSAAYKWLSSRAPEYFRPTGRSVVVNNATIIALLKQVPDSRRVVPKDDDLLLGAEEITALPEPAPPSPEFVPLTSVVDPSTLPVGLTRRLSRWSAPGSVHRDD